MSPAFAAHVHLLVGAADASSSDSQPASPSHAAPVPASAANDSAAAEPDAVQREDWMTKSFPKAADPAALTGAKAAQLKVDRTCIHMYVDANTSY